MSGPSSIAPQVDDKFGQNSLEEKQKEVSLEINDQLDFKPENNGGDHKFASSTSQHEPIVTRRELWSYYRQ